MGVGGAPRAALLLALVPAAAFAGETLLAIDPRGGTDGALSSDGETIVASSHRTASWSLWTYSIAEGTWSPLTDDAGDDTEPQWSPDGRRVVFSSTRGGEKDIWTVELASGQLTRLTGAATADEEYPAFSPDGLWVTFTGGAWKRRNVYMIPSTGGTVRPVLKEPTHVGACSFAAAPDRLVCHTYDRGFGDLIEIAVDDGAVRRLTTGESWHYKPTMGPGGHLVAYNEIGESGDRIRLAVRGADGITQSRFDIAGRWPAMTNDNRRVFFHRLADAGNEVRLLDTETGEVRTVVGAARRPGRASLSPDGRRVAYCAQAGGNSEIRLVDLAEGRDQAFALPAPACFPAWAPDGATLAFTYRASKRWEVATVDANGRDLRVWTQDWTELRDLNAPLAWSPEGGRIAFTTTTAPYESDIMVLELATGRINRATSDASYDEGPRWTPDGRRLVFMSTRGGDWTWGLFEREVETGETRPLLAPDYIEKRYPIFDATGRLYWIESDFCLGATFIIRQERNGEQHQFHEEPGAEWVEASTDGRYLLFTRMSRRTEYWLADVDIDWQEPK